MASCLLLCKIQILQSIVVGPVCTGMFLLCKIQILQSIVDGPVCLFVIFFVCQHSLGRNFYAIALIFFQVIGI